MRNRHHRRAARELTAFAKRGAERHVAGVVDEHVRRHEPQEDAEVANHDGDDGSQCRHGLGVVHADGSHSIQGRVAIEDRVGERHPAARGRRLLTVVKDDGVAGDEEAPCDCRADVADYRESGLSPRLL